MFLTESQHLVLNQEFLGCLGCLESPNLGCSCTVLSQLPSVRSLPWWLLCSDGTWTDLARSIRLVSMGLGAWKEIRTSWDPPFYFTIFYNDIYIYIYVYIYKYIIYIVYIYTYILVLLVLFLLILVLVLILCLVNRLMVPLRIPLLSQEKRRSSCSRQKRKVMPSSCSIMETGLPSQPLDHVFGGFFRCSWFLEEYDTDQIVV